MRDAFLRNNPTNEKDTDFVNRVFTGSQIEKSYSSLNEEDLFRRMCREEYISHVKKTLKGMGTRAAIGAIGEWADRVGQMYDVCKNKITHIIWGSMTGGMHAPTMDIEIIYALGLSRSVKRLNVENMGCLTGFRCLALASSLAKEDPNNYVLVVIGDVRNALGNLMTNHIPGDPIDKSNVITASLFRDSCAAAIVSQDSLGALYRIIQHESYLIHDSFDLVKYTEKDNDRVHLFISKELPGIVAHYVGDFVQSLLCGPSSTIPIFDPKNMDICCHTGGPRVIKGVRDALGVSDENMMATWHVMRNYGNLSGSSNMAVLDFNRKRDINPSPHNHCICLSFGPGVGMEGLLLQLM